MGLLTAALRVVFCETGSRLWYLGTTSRYEGSWLHVRRGEEKGPACLVCRVVGVNVSIALSGSSG